MITERAVSSVQIKGSQDQHQAEINTVAPLGTRSKPEGLGRHRGATTCGVKGPVASGSREPDNRRLYQGGRDVRAAGGS
jgi:hypothetical protein